MIDFHCHLDLYPNALQLLSEVERRNSFTFAVTTSPRAFVATSRVFAPFRHIHVGLGLHPEVAQAKVGELDQLVALVRQAKLVGEIGLDGTTRFKQTLGLQRRIFSAAVAECSAQGCRVMSIHSRGAEAEVLATLSLHPNAGIPVLHWFPGNQRDLSRAVQLGAGFSIGPAMLRAESGRQIAVQLPIDRVLPETDGPFAQSKGAPLMPWEAWGVCKTLSELWGQPEHHVRDQMLANVQTLLAMIARS